MKLVVRLAILLGFIAGFFSPTFASTTSYPTTLPQDERVFCLSTLDMDEAIDFGLYPEDKRFFFFLKRNADKMVTTCEWLSVARMWYVGRSIGAAKTTDPMVRSLFFVEKETFQEWHTWMYLD